MEQIASVLQGTLEANAYLRKGAEERLRQMESTSGYILQLVQLVTSEQTEMQIRMAAAIALKNFVKRNWGDAPEVEMSKEDETSFRQILLESMFNCRGNIQEIISHALHLIAQRDFPEKWPELVPYLSNLLSSENLDHLVASLTTMDQIFRKFRYETKSTVLWTELKACLLSAQEPLTGLLGNMMNVMERKDQLGAEGVAQWLRVLNLIVRVYHSLCSQDIPEYFEDNIKPWMESLLSLISMECPTQVSSAGEPTTIDELKTEICETFTLYAQRYEEEVAIFVPRVITAVWALVEKTNQETRYDTMVCAALEFLSIICQRTYYSSHFTGENILQTIAQNVCVKNLHLRQEDLELFEDEPLDYMKRDLEGTDIGTRRRGAIDLVRALCQRFEAQMLPSLTQIVQSLIMEGNWIKIDVVYCLVTAMAAKTETSKSGVTMANPLVNVADFFSSQVRLHLTSNIDETPILKADALKFSVTFRNQLSPECLLEVIQAADNLLSSNTPVIHKYAAHAIERILLVQNQNTNSSLFTAQVIPVSSILTNLVAAFDKDPKSQNSPYLIKAMLRVITLLDNETMQHAEAIATKLAQLVASATKTSADSVHTHFLFETICVLVMKKKNVGGGLDEQLMPLIEVIFTEDIEDLIPYALQITGVLLSSCVARQAPIDAYFSFLPFLLSERLWARSANVPAAISVLEVFLCSNGQRVLSEYSPLILAHFTRLISSKALDQHGFQLVAALLPVIEFCVGVNNPLTMIFNTMFKRIQMSKTGKFMKMFVVFFCKFAIIRSAEELVKAVEMVQPGMFNMIVEKILLPELPTLKSMVTLQDKRIIAIGAANLLGDATQFMSPHYGKFSEEVASLLETSAVSDRAGLTPEEEQAAMYNTEGEFVNPYCRLSYAPKPEPVASQITNFKQYFAQAVLVKGPSNNSSVLSCVPQELIQYLSSVQS